MSDQLQEGFYKDKYGRIQPERRSGKDRRGIKATFKDHERRRIFRRKADRELLEKDHRGMIEDALQDFADDHQGRL